MYAQKEVTEIKTPHSCVGHRITLPSHKNRNLERIFFFILVSMSDIYAFSNDFSPDFLNFKCFLKYSNIVNTFKYYKYFYNIRELVSNFLWFNFTKQKYFCI